MVKILTFYIILTLIFTMSEKGLKLKLKLDDIFRILYDAYDVWKSKNNNLQGQSNRRNMRDRSCQVKRPWQNK